VNLRINQQQADACGDIRLSAGSVVEIAGGGHWYGHGFAHDQPYPLEAGAVINPALAVNNIQCPVWMCSEGYVFLLRTVAPVDVQVNKDGNAGVRLVPSGDCVLSVFGAGNLRASVGEFWRNIGAFGQAPAAGWPVGDSIFCTWTQYPRCINRERVLDMARAIRAHEYPCTMLTIDDRWESCFGELRFGRDFPDPAGMVRELHAMGFKVLLWVTPFVNRESTVFAELERKKVLVGSKDGCGAAMLKWWGGEAGLVDVTGAAGRQWYREQLLRLRDETGVDGFKIDGGDAKYQPAPDTAAWSDYRGASGYADALLGLFEELAPGMCETRTAWLSQHRRLIWRLGGKDSHWGRDNGLKAVLNLSLHLSLMGYDLLIPDMIPGRVQTLVSDMPLPTDELMVRWTELSAFFPLMQFSYFPWNYGRPTAEAALNFARLHKDLEPCLVRLLRERTEPLLRPMWLADGLSDAAYTVSDQFMLGPDLLVAPVLDSGVTERQVMLPSGTWVNGWSGQTIDGGTVHRLPAPCPGAPVLVRSSNRELVGAVTAALKRIATGTVVPGITTATYRAGLDRDLNVTG